jgi:hypothetical protein
MSRSCCRLACCPQPWFRVRSRLRVLVLLGLLCWLGPPAWAKEANKTICCRSSGGTRSTSPNFWAHLVPLSNRFDPGVSRTLALLQGRSPNPAAFTLQFSTPAGELVGEQTLAPRAAGIRLLTLPDTNRGVLNQSLIWESFPTGRPNRPPTRSSLVSLPPAEPDSSHQALAGLRQSCGGVVDTAPLLRAFGMEEFREKLPARLPVLCEALAVDLFGIKPAQGSGSTPSVPLESR